MKNELFDELVGSIKEAGAYLRSEQTPAVVSFVAEPDPRPIRKRLGLTQDQFAVALCGSVTTLRDWEQGRRDPSGPAMRLLQIAAKHPEIILESE
ncbi:MAG TPA: helix-turn-helix domain-containing protein [Longimicrobium sp.]|jgi:putative transcriptional regulator